MPAICNTLASVIIIGGAFTIVGIVLLILGGTYDSYFCQASCDAECPFATFEYGESGDMRCDDCRYAESVGGVMTCRNINVTKQVHAVYGALTGIGGMMLAWAVSISFAKLLSLLKRITIDTSKRSTIMLVLCFVLLALGVMFFVIRVNAPGIACQSICNPECAYSSVRYRDWYAIVDFDGRQVNCDICDYSGCDTLSATDETLVIAQLGLGLGIPFTVVGGIIGVIWLVKAVIMPTKNGGTAKPNNTA